MCTLRLILLFIFAIFQFKRKTYCKSPFSFPIIVKRKTKLDNVPSFAEEMHSCSLQIYLPNAPFGIPSLPAAELSIHILTETVLRFFERVSSVRGNHLPIVFWLYVYKVLTIEIAKKNSYRIKKCNHTFHSEIKAIC